MLIPNKPYLWLQNDGGRKVVYMKLWCISGFGLEPNLTLPGPSVSPEQIKTGTTLELKYKVLPGYHTPELIEFDLTASYSTFPSPDKVVVTIINEADIVLGMCAIKPGCEFSATPNLPYLIPFLYIRAGASNPDVHIAALLPANSLLKVLPPKLVHGKLNVDCDINPTVAGFSFVHDEFNVGDHPPDEVIVALNEQTGYKRRGSGTVHTSEADASK